MSEEPEERRRHPLEDPEPIEEPETKETQNPQKKSIPIVVAEKQPYFTYTLIAINVVIFMVMQSNSELRVELYLSNWLDPHLVLGDFQVQRLLTAMFLHGSVAHVALNMLSLYNIGRQVEKIYGRYRFLLIYFLGGLMGSVVSAGIGSYDVPSVGASGAILAIWAAYLWLLYSNRVFFGESAQRALRFDVIYLVFFLLLGFAPGSNIDNWGHIGGFAGGLLIAYLMPVRFQPIRLRQAVVGNEMVIVDSNRFDVQKMYPFMGIVALTLGIAFFLAAIGYRMNLFG